MFIVQKYFLVVSRTVGRKLKKKKYISVYYGIDGNTTTSRRMIIILLLFSSALYGSIDFFLFPLSLSSSPLTLFLPRRSRFILFTGRLRFFRVLKFDFISITLFLRHRTTVGQYTFIYIYIYIHKWSLRYCVVVFRNVNSIDFPFRRPISGRVRLMYSSSS